MIFLWSKSNRPGSKLIRWGREDDCSHFAVCFDKLGEMNERKNAWIIGESRLETGVGIDWLSAFKSRNEVVHALEFLPVSDDTEAYLLFEAEMSGKKYDTKAVSWLSLDSILYKLRIRNPYRENKWADKDQVFCVEVLSAFRDILSKSGILITNDLSAMDPHDLLEILLTRDSFREINNL